MSGECERIERLLDETEVPALPADLAAHARSCDACRLRLDIARDLRARLGAGVGLAESRRAALVDRIVRAGKSARAHRPVRRRVWIAAATLAAAAVVAAILLWPARPEPVLPTDVFAYMLGPFAEAPAKEEAGDAPAERASPLEDALGLFWNDMEGPVGLARSAMEAPRAAVPPPPAAKNK